MIKKKGQKIHDSYFKHMFSHPEVVADFLKSNLSKGLLHQLDLSTLQKRDKEFLPTKYRNSRLADLLYSVSKKNGEKIFLLLHLEAQGTPDKLMGVRVIEYHIAIIREYLQEGATQVPTIISFVFYHSEEEWQGAKSISALFSNFETYLHESLRKSFLVNLPREAFEKLQAQGLASAPQMVLAKQPSGDVASIFGELMPMLDGQQKCCKDETIKYVFSVDKREDEEIIEELSKFDQETAQNYRVMFERSIKKYKREGRQEGRLNAFKEMIAKGLISKKDAERLLKE